MIFSQLFQPLFLNFLRYFQRIQQLGIADCKKHQQKLTMSSINNQYAAYTFFGNLMIHKQYQNHISKLSYISLSRQLKVHFSEETRYQIQCKDGYLQLIYKSLQNYKLLIFRYCSIQASMQEQVNKKVHPGLKLAKYNNETLGYGLYIRDNFVFSSAFGTLQSSTINFQTVYTVFNNFPNKKVGISIGDIVYARVLKVKQEECIVQILQVNSISCISKQGKCLEGAIRKENVREKMVDSVIMIDSFRPRDIVKAKVLSLGDSLRGMYLTTASENLGVVVAENQQTKRLMLPFDWTTMVDPQQLVKQPRKVCKPE